MNIKSKSPKNYKQYVLNIVLIIVGLLALAACSGGLTEITVPDDEVVENTNLPALQPVNVEELQPVENTNESLPIGETPETELERFESFGVAFSYPASFINDIQFVEDANSDMDITISGNPHPLLFTLDLNNQTQGSSLLIQPIREKNGLFYTTLSEAQLAQYSELEMRLGSEQADGEMVQGIELVNGQGIRSIIKDESGTFYRFEGMTNNGRYAIEFVFAVTDDGVFADQLALLDEMIESLYIDGAAEMLNAANCTDDAEFVENVTIPDRTEIEPGDTFVKTWRMRNVGTCTWTNNYSWAFKGGNALTIQEISPLDIVSPGEEVDISVTLIAPDSPGLYSGEWQLSGSNQFEGFGPEVYYLITVPDA